MARRKQVAPMQRINSGEVMQHLPEQAEKPAMYSNGHVKHPSAVSRPSRASSQPSFLALIICVAGIYASFLLWAFLQERITTIPYASEPSTLHPTSATERFKYPIFLNTIQSLLAFISGSLYLFSTTPSHSSPLPSTRALLPLLSISITQTLASPFGYASLTHVDYLTFTLAKSCKLLPVMFLHILLYRKRYPLSKYLIVLAVTAGVAIFTLSHPPSPSKPSKPTPTSSIYGLSLLGINLLFDGLTNTTQDHIFSSPARYGPISGPQMMAVTNLFSFGLMSAYLLLLPLIPPSLLPYFIPTSATHELTLATSFISRHPAVLYDVLGFCAAGAIGQLFIFATLNRFGSLLLVTVTVTRKMLTMTLSVVWWGKSLTVGQWAGVGIAFGGIGMEGLVQRREKREKDRRKQEGKKL